VTDPRKRARQRDDAPLVLQARAGRGKRARARDSASRPTQARVSGGKREQIRGSPAEPGDNVAVARDSAPDPVSDLAPRYLRLDDVAVYLSVSTPQVYALVRSGDLPAVKIGGRGVWRVDRTKLDAYLEQLETETAEWAKAHPLNPRDKGDLLEEEAD
jgi:excisionase family DNA binding protein